MSDQSYHTTCKVNQCPLRATVVTDYWPQEKKRDPKLPRWGICDHHSKAKAADWTATTHRILANQQSLEIADMMAGISDHRYKPITGETVEHWQARLNRHIQSVLFPDQQASAAEPSGAFDAVKQMLQTSGQQVITR